MVRTRRKASAIDNSSRQQCSLGGSVNTGCCPICRGVYRLNASGCLRVHGRLDSRCSGSGQSLNFGSINLTSLDGAGQVAFVGVRDSFGASSDLRSATPPVELSSSPFKEPTRTTSELLRRVWMQPVNTIKRIPWNLRRRIANIYSSLLLQAMCSNSFHDWERLLCFPKFCLASTMNRAQACDHTGTKISLLLDKFETGEDGDCFSPSDVRPSRKLNRFVSTNNDYSEAIELTRSGNYGKAMRRLTSSNICEYSQSTRIQLSVLHPVNGDLPASRPPCLTLPLSVDSDIIQAAVSSFPSLTSPGSLGLRAEHLKDMMSVDHGVLLGRLTSLVNYLIAGLAPVELSPFLAGASLLALSKPDGGVRPIAIGETLRRLCAKCICRKLRSRFSESLLPHQLGVATPNGMEQIIHRVRRLHHLQHQNDDWVWVKVDITNAFNTLSRRSFIDAVRSEFPEISRWISWCYGSGSNLRFGNMEPLQSLSGVQQGDPLGPLLFCLALKPIIASISTIEGIGLNLWYLDDGIVGGRPEAVGKALSLLSLDFPAIGLSLNWKKTELIGKASNIDLVKRLCPGITLVNSTDNFTILGSPVGSQEHCSSHLINKVLPALQLDLKTLENLPDPQVAFILLRNCASAARVNHLMRTVDPAFAQKFFRLFDDLVLDCFSNITSIHPDKKTWSQACLPLKMGGLGLRSCVEHSAAAFLSSVEMVAKQSNLDPYSFPSFESAISNFPHDDRGLQSNQRGLSHSIDETSRRKLLESVDCSNSARLLAVSRPHACAWLQAIPNKATLMNLAPNEFVVLLRMWLGMPLCKGDYRCRRCLRMADKFGFHALTCQFGGYPGIRHDGLRDTIFQAAVSAGLRVAKEVPNLVRNLRERPADILIYEDPPLAVDFAVTNPLQNAYVSMAAKIPGYAADKYAACVKDRKYKRKMEESGYSFSAAVIETYGGWNAQGEKLVRFIARSMSWRGSISYSKAANQLFQRVSISLMRGNAKAILKSLEDLGRPIIESSVGLYDDPTPRLNSSEFLTQVAALSEEIVIRETILPTVRNVDIHINDVNQNLRILHSGGVLDFQTGKDESPIKQTPSYPTRLLVTQSSNTENEGVVATTSVIGIEQPCNKSNLINSDCEGWTGQNFVIAGDSAGHNIVMSVFLMSMKRGIRIPDRLFGFCPAYCLSSGISPSRLVSLVGPFLNFSVMTTCEETKGLGKVVVACGFTDAPNVIRGINMDTFDVQNTSIMSRKSPLTICITNEELVPKYFELDDHTCAVDANAGSILIFDYSKESNQIVNSNQVIGDIGSLCYLDYTKSQLLSLVSIRLGGPGLYEMPSNMCPRTPLNSLPNPAMGTERRQRQRSRRMWQKQRRTTTLFFLPPRRTVTVRNADKYVDTLLHLAESSNVDGETSKADKSTDKAESIE